MNKVVRNCQNNISAAGVHNPDKEKDDDDKCKVAKHPTGVPDTLLQYPVVANNCSQKYTV